jgi:hypothetical protein
MGSDLASCGRSVLVSWPVPGLDDDQRRDTRPLRTASREKRDLAVRARLRLAWRARRLGVPTSRDSPRWLDREDHVWIQEFSHPPAQRRSLGLDWTVSPGTVLFPLGDAANGRGAKGVTDGSETRTHPARALRGSRVARRPGPRRQARGENSRRPRRRAATRAGRGPAFQARMT